ncbi:hypothetical protein [Micromonospora sp. MH99]|uniref:hypothetical protein n=1 Tax=Micromonospora sp. MH99 TaxID=1945510 RepID=UPI001F1DB3D6|nr:hypothetical protein [Micromonospora sp. MH99]MCF0095383.1 hypothetical protein [Micromonospora sp. MH99]
MGQGFVVRYEMRPDSAEENQRLIEEVFAELTAERPDGLSYAAFRLADGVTFVHVGVSDGSNALGGVEAFAAFQRDFKARVAGGPEAAEAELIGSYGFDAQHLTQ